MVREMITQIAALRPKRLIVCLLVVLVSTHIDPASAQTGPDWHKSDGPTAEITATPTPDLAPQTTASRGLNLLEGISKFFPLMFRHVQADLPSIRNGDFELGQNGDWIEAWMQVDYIITNFDLPLTPHSGEWIAWLGGVDNEDNKLYQTLSLPPDRAAYLNFYYQTHSDETQCNQDLADVTVNQTKVHTFSLCESTNTSAWERVTLNLRSYAGQQAMISFNLKSNGSSWSSVVIDDVSLSPTP
jgi:hypothetical protein